MRSHHQVPFPVLIGDLGGTNARFAVVPEADAPIEELPIVHTASFPTMDEAIAEAVFARTAHPPRSAVIAIAGAIRTERIAFTNAKWVVEPRQLIARFGFHDIIVLNDFEAQSLALPEFTDADLDPIGGGEAMEFGTRLAVGPGTGLGAGALLHARGTWIPVASEAGHVDFGPTTARDLAIWPHLARLHGDRISAETLMSGQGLLNLYNAIVAADGKSREFETPADITGAALAGSDPAAVEAVELFATYLGRLAGDLALTFLARGGVYLAGGIPPHIAPVLKSGAFRAAFEAKEPHRALLEGIPTSIITHATPAFLGLAAFARRQERFGVSLDGRHWQGSTN
jgi:glucokinase